ncbi:unnamed protein product [Toxocara canis]|uniref:Mic1 domain-containing protein n=1 Tax=Toxocara canis TaxID=6265 RepID=A0A183UHF0_TOXCA|nr:unnamed protein product [Toxocara canis]
MKDSGKIKIMKFSPDQRVASVQCEESSVDFVCVSPTGDGTICAQFSQSTKMRSARIVGLEWVANNQILFVTNQPKSQLLIVSTGVSGALLNPFLIQNGVLHRLQKFEVDFGCSNAKTNLIEREVTVASVMSLAKRLTSYSYGSLYVMVLRYSLRDSSTSDVAMYRLGEDSDEYALTHTLALARTGAFAIHVIDNVIVVHHQTSATSLLFDIRVGDTKRSGVIVHRPLMSISLTRSDRLANEYHGEIPLYSPSWVIFAPNLIVDASIGIFSTVSLYPENAEHGIANKCDFLQFVLNRRSTKDLFLEKFKSLLIGNHLSLKEVSKVFAWIVEPYAKRMMPSLKYNEGVAKFALAAEPYEPLIIEQSDMVSRVFLPANECPSINKQHFVQCMLHYLLSLQENNIDPEPYYLNEILVPAMVAAGELNRLQQLLHYRVVPDAKQLAFQLLSHEAKHAPLIQLAVDMLARLGTAAEEIVEVLLSRGQLVEAIRFLDGLSPSEKVNSMKLVEHAWKQDRQVRYAVFSYFQDRSTRSRSNNFTNSEQYDDYLRRFKALFTNEEVEAAKHDSQFAVVLPR